MVSRTTASTTPTSGPVHTLVLMQNTTRGSDAGGVVCSGRCISHHTHQGRQNVVPFEYLVAAAGGARGVLRCFHFVAGTQ